MNNVDFAYLYTSTEGRIGRQSYWIGIVGFIVVALVITLIVGALFGLLSTIGQVLLFILQLIFIYPSYCLMGKRFQDREKPATFAWIGIGLGLLTGFLNMLGLTRGDFGQPNWLGWILNIALLIVGIWFLIELGFLRGTVGPNEYGPDPLQEPARAIR